MNYKLTFLKSREDKMNGVLKMAESNGRVNMSFINVQNGRIKDGGDVPMGAIGDIVGSDTWIGILLERS